MWCKLLEVGAIYKTSKMGTIFEARRDSSVPAGVFELFRLCRKDPCAFVAGSKSAGSKSAPRRVGVYHVSRLAYTGINEPPGKLPIAPLVGVAPVDQVLWSAWKTGLAVVVAASAGWGRLRSELPEMPPRELLAYAVNRSFKFLGDTVIGVCRSIESGFFEGMAESVWMGPPVWFLVILRVAVYGYFAYRYSLVPRALGKALYTWNNWRSSQVVHTPARASRPTTPPSSTDPSSDRDDDTCMGFTVYMSMEGRTIPSPHRDCRDVSYLDCRLVGEDATASHLPEICRETGVPLCKIHHDVYMSLRGHSVCSIVGCNRLGSPAPDGVCYCSTHIADALNPRPPTPEVIFGKKPKQSDPTGLERLPDPVLLDLYERYEAQGAPEPDIAPQLTTEYGGDLLPNAKIINKLRAGSSDAGLDDMMRRVGRIDMVSANSYPRNDPVPHPDYTAPMPFTERPFPPPIAAFATAPPVVVRVPFCNPSGVSPDALNRDVVAPPPPPWPNATPLVVPGRFIPAPAHQVFPASHATLVPAPPVHPDPLFNAQPLTLGSVASSGQPLGLNLTSSTPDAVSPIPGAPSGSDGQNSILTSLVYHVDRIANPDTSTKPGAIEIIRRNEEILVYVARFFDNNTVALCPGSPGRPWMWGSNPSTKNCDLCTISIVSPEVSATGFVLRPHACTGGGSDKEEEYYLAESDFPTWPTRDFDRYAFPSGCPIEPRAREPHHVETWKINASNMARMFSAVYGAELLQERLGAIEYLRSLHIDYPRKYTLSSIRSAWGTLNYLWVQELRDMTNILRMHAQVDRPTFAQLRSIGMTVVVSTWKTVYQRPTTFNLTEPPGYFATEIVRRTNEEKELNEWDSYQTSVPRGGNPRVGALPEPTGLPGPPMTPVERRLAGKEAPKTASGSRI